MPGNKSGRFKTTRYEWGKGRLRMGPRPFLFLEWELDLVGAGNTCLTEMWNYGSPV